jgi:hypothetical protein
MNLCLGAAFPPLPAVGLVTFAGLEVGLVTVLDCYDKGARRGVPVSKQR